jgi:4-amino-4-deoxy-L-arabinose transferase-like glycosyltransferase
VRDRVPLPLAALLAASLLLALLWAVLTPLFQAPDEQAHFAYTQYLAETGNLPGDPAKPIYSSEHVQAAIALNADQVPGQPMVKPEWSDRLYDAWRTPPPQGRHAGDGGGLNTAASNPPASYLWQAAAYELVGGHDVPSRLFAMRLASLLWLPVTVLATWLLAGEAFGRRRILQTCAAAVPALFPMVTFMSASASPEGMLYALWALALWLGVRILRRGLTAASAAGLAAAVALACVTKATSYALLPGFVLVLVAGLWRARGAAPTLLARRAAAAVVPAAAILGAWFAVAGSLSRPAAAQVTTATRPSGIDLADFASYVWQFYLPRLPGMPQFSFHPNGYPLFQVWIKQGWAAFGWLEVRYPVVVYQVLALVTVAVLAGGAVALWRARGHVDVVVIAFVGLVVVSLLAGLHWTDYGFQLAGNAFMQGRYLFPILPVGALAFAGAISLVPARRVHAAAGVGVAALVGFHVAALGLVVYRFYA